MTDALVDSCRREVSRCRAALTAGSHRDFWVRRLRIAIAKLRAGLNLLEQQLVAMGEVER